MITINKEKWTVVTPWHNQSQRESFLAAWGPRGDELFMLKDENAIGCGAMKNLCVRQAMRDGADGVVVLDDDCYPDFNGPQTLSELIEEHVRALEPQPVEMILEVTKPMSRGTPYYCRSINMPVAASMGFWSCIGDYDASAQLIHGPEHPMTFHKKAVYSKYFPLCGMNLAFRPRSWFPWCNFIEVPRMDDIWMGWLWQREAYRTRHCFNLNGPMVRHSRQSNVWANLKHEAMWLEANETLWRDIATSQKNNYDDLYRLISQLID